MKFCEKCGAKLRDGACFCPSCGVGQGEHGGAGTRQEKSGNAEAAGDRAVAALAYLGPLAFAALFMAKGSGFVRHHANQGIVLFLASAAYSIVGSVLEKVVLTVFWWAYAVIGIIGIVGLVFPILACIGIVNAVNGQEKELPVIGKINLLK